MNAHTKRPDNASPKYVVLSQGSSTYYVQHARAFANCEKLETTVKGVYLIMGRDPMVLKPLNIFGSQMFNGAACPIFQLQQDFAGPKHNMQFCV